MRQVKKFKSGWTVKVHNYKKPVTGDINKTVVY